MDNAIENPSNGQESSQRPEDAGKISPQSVPEQISNKCQDAASKSSANLDDGAMSRALKMS